MAQTSVAQFASELKVPPSVLLEQLRAAGVEKRVPEDSLTDSDKSRLLEYLRKTHGSAESKMRFATQSAHANCIRTAASRRRVLRAWASRVRSPIRKRFCNTWNRP